MYKTLFSEMSEFYQKYRETILSCRKKHYMEHGEKERLYAKQYNIEHKDSIRQYKKEYLANPVNYERHKEAVKKRQQRKRDFTKEFQRLANLAEL